MLISLWLQLKTSTGCAIIGVSLISLHLFKATCKACIYDEVIADVFLGFASKICLLWPRVKHSQMKRSADTDQGQLHTLTGILCALDKQLYHVRVFWFRMGVGCDYTWHF